MSALPPSVTVLLVILAAAFTVMMGFATTKLFGVADAEEASFNQISPQQLAYMREVRERNIREILSQLEPQRGHGK
jgi:hypothetical protein